jgi:hypothetical protein
MRQEWRLRQRRGAYGTWSGTSPGTWSAEYWRPRLGGLQDFCIIFCREDSFKQSPRLCPSTAFRFCSSLSPST